MSEEFISSVEEMRFDRQGAYQAMALVGDAGSAFRTWHIRILHRGRLARDECILPIVDGASVGV